MSFLLGLATFSAQGFLPDAGRSFANSASGWTLLTALLIYVARVSPRLTSALGALSFVLLVIGYTAGASLQSLSYNPLFFGVVGLAVGPFIGLAAAWLREGGVLAALATALLSGVFAGEAAYGLTVIADTTRPEYWVATGALGILLLLGMLVWRLRGPVPVVLGIVGTAVVASTFVAAYTGLGSI